MNDDTPKLSRHEQAVIAGKASRLADVYKRSPGLTERAVAIKFRDYPTDPAYPRNGNCSTGRCEDCDWCDFMTVFSAERVLELLDSDLAGFLARHGESIAANLEAIIPDWRGSPEGLAGVRAALAEIEGKSIMNEEDLKDAQAHYYDAGGMPSQSMVPREAGWFWRRAAKAWRPQALHYRQVLRDIAKKIVQTIDDPEEIPEDVVGTIESSGACTAAETEAWGREVCP